MAKITPIKSENIDYGSVRIANQKIEIASKAMILFTDEDFSSGSFVYDCAQIIQEASDEIREVLGGIDFGSKP